MSECPNRVYAATNVPHPKVPNVTCWQCGQPLPEHPFEQSSLVPPGQMYVISTVPENPPVPRKVTS